MPAVSVSEKLDLEQGLQFQSNQTEPVGYLVSFGLGGTALTADIGVVDPTNRAQSRVVGILDQVDWQGKATDPITLTANVSEANRQMLWALHSQALRNTSLVFAFRTYGYDVHTKQYFENFAPTMPPLATSVTTHDGEPVMDIAGSPNGQPPTWRVSVVIAPPPEEQVLMIAHSPTAKLAQTWGLAPVKR